MMIWIFGVGCGFVAGTSLMVWLEHRAMRYRNAMETGGCPAFRGNDD